MPQSLVRTPRDAALALEVNGRSLVGAHAQLVSILKSRLGQNHGDLLAQPKTLPEGDTAWSTPLEGAVLPVAQLGPEERQKLQQRADRLSADILGLAGQMRSEGPAAQVVAQMLERVLTLPPGDWLYSVGGKPVLVMWGHAAAGAVLPPSALPAPPAVVAAPAAAAVPPAAVPVAAPAGQATVDLLAASAASPPPPPDLPPPAAAPPPKKRWWLWLLAALLLLALLLFGLRQCSQADSAAAAALEAQLAEAEARNRAIEEELRRKRAAQMMCVPDPVAPAASAPEPPASAPEPPASAPEPPAPASAPPSPLDSLRKKVADAGNKCDTLIDLLKRDAMLKSREAADVRKDVVETLQQRCKDTLVKEAKNLCPGERPKQVVPEFVIVFDASPSMAYSLNATPADIRRAELFQRPEMVTGDPQRIKPAREAAIEVAKRVPSDMSTGLVMVDSCASGARPLGFYGPGQRGSLIGQLAGVRPHPFAPGGGTPLADGVARAGQMVDGVSRDATILVISDGQESCRGNPCAVASALARAKPRLKINVLDISGSGAGNCVAAATGGQVFTANNAPDVIASMRRAAQEVMGPASCRK